MSKLTISKCSRCRVEIPPLHIVTILLGPASYGVDSRGHKYCYLCCAHRDIQNMKKVRRISLYLTVVDKLQTSSRTAVVGKGTGCEVTNWPGTLRFPVESYSISRHNIGRTRVDFWFNFEGYVWHGVNIGDGQLSHCRRTKRKVGTHEA